MVGDRDGYVWLFINNGSATSPVLAMAGKIKANNSTIDVGANSCLVVTDWNNDSKKDLVIGNEDGNIRVYLNTGTNSAPTFGSSTVVANVSYYRGSPEVVDLNRDGKKDLIVGDNNGYVNFHANVGSDAEPRFASGGGLRLKIQGGSDLKVDYGAHIDVADWDANGRLDLLVGDFDGYVRLFLNTASGSDVDDPNTEVARDFSLDQNYPNPFNARTTITYKISKPGNFHLSIFNATGQWVETLVSDYHVAGEYSIEWEASEATSGLYFYRLVSGHCSATRKCLLLR